MKDGIPNPAYIKATLKNLLIKIGLQLILKNQTSFCWLIDLLEVKSKIAGKIKAYQSLQNYHAVTKHLKNFQKATKYLITFESINLDFFYKYTTYQRILSAYHLIQ